MVLKKEDIKTFLENEVTAKLALSLIKNKFNVELPNNGILAGQALASAIMELLDIGISPIYNDIDIFYLINDYTLDKKRSIKEIIKERSNKTVRFSEVVTEYDHYNHKNYYYDKYSYKVEVSLKSGPLNKTYISYHGFVGDIKNLSSLIINNFDINSTQVAISLYNGNLEYTEEFVEFLYTKQLKVVRYNTPIHSYIRLAKKHAELKGTYVNIEEEKMLAMVYISTIKNLQESKRVLEGFKLMGVDHDINEVLNFSNIISSDITEKPILFGSIHREEVKKYISKDLRSLYDCITHSRDKSLYDHIMNDREKYDSYKPTEFYSEDMLILEGKDLTDYNVKKSSKILLTDTIDYSKSAGELTTLATSDPDKYFQQYLENISSFGVKSSKEFKFMLKKIEHLFFNLNKESTYKALQGGAEQIKKYDRSFVFTGNGETDIINVLSYQVGKLGAMYKSFQSTKKSTKKIFFMNNKQYKDLYGYDLCEEYLSATLYTTVNKVTLNTIQEIGKYINLIKDHNIHLFRSLDLNEAVTFLKNLRSLKKEYGEYIIGYLENDTNLSKYIVLDYSKFKAYIEDKLQLERKALKENSLSFNLENKYIVQELITSRELKEEGEYMGHCVGGYSHLVREGGTFIFSVKTTDKSHRATIEIVKEDSGDNYRLVQYKGRFNKHFTFKEAKPVLIELNKYFKTIFPMPKFLTREFTDIEKSDYHFFKDVLEDNIGPQRVGVYQPPEMNQDFPVIDIDDDDIPF